MQKTFVIVLLLCSAVAAPGQGTVQFSNGAFSRIFIFPDILVVPTPQPWLNFGLFYGIGESTSPSLLPQLGVNSTITAGVIANSSDGKSAMNTVQLPGTVPGETDVWIQVKGWDASFGTDWPAAITQGSWFGQTTIVNVGALGPTTGPGLNIWQGATGTDPTRISWLMIVPEPSTFALAGLGAVMLMLFHRRT